MKNEPLIENIDRLHTTPMGVDRIKRNLKLDTDDAVSYCKDLILNPQCHIARQGENWYCDEHCNAGYAYRTTSFHYPWLEPSLSR